ncbi:intercellular adhesion molecule 2 isoform X2 [Mus pahari]|nr:intercellular adhesion molecule 2 isoform X2 [Mus pahari]
MGGLETSMNKIMLEEHPQGKWKQFLISNVSKDTVFLCHFTCSGKQHSESLNISVYQPPAQVTLKLQPPRVIVGETFTVECKVSPVKPLEWLTLSLLRGRETLKSQTFGGAETDPQEATATFNSTALKKDGLNFSCQAELDLRPHGGYIIRSISEYQILEVYALAQKTDRHLRGASCLEEVAPSLPDTFRVSQHCQAPGGYQNSTWRLQGVVQHWLKDCGSSRRGWGHFLFFFSLNTNTWISPCARHDCSGDNSQHLCQGKYQVFPVYSVSSALPTPCSFPGLFGASASQTPDIYPHRLGANYFLLRSYEVKDILFTPDPGDLMLLLVESGHSPDSPFCQH